MAAPTRLCNFADHRLPRSDGGRFPGRLFLNAAGMGIDKPELVSMLTISVRERYRYDWSALARDSPGMAAETGRAAEADGVEPGEMANADAFVPCAGAVDSGRDCVPSRG